MATCGGLIMRPPRPAPAALPRPRPRRLGPAVPRDVPDDTAPGLDAVPLPPVSRACSGSRSPYTARCRLLRRKHAAVQVSNKSRPLVACTAGAHSTHRHDGWVAHWASKRVKRLDLRCIVCMCALVICAPRPRALTAGPPLPPRPRRLTMPPVAASAAAFSVGLRRRSDTDRPRAAPRPRPRPPRPAPAEPPRPANHWHIAVSRERLPGKTARNALAVRGQQVQNGTRHQVLAVGPRASGTCLATQPRAVFKAIAT